MGSISEETWTAFLQRIGITPQPIELTQLLTLYEEYSQRIKELYTLDLQEREAPSIFRPEEDSK